MRIVALFLLCLACAAGCGTKRAAGPVWSDPGTDGRPGESNVANKSAGMPEKVFAGRVASANVTARFVVLSFPLGRMPSLDQRLHVYRGGVRVAELKVTGPQSDDAIVADVTAGNAEAGDEVRDR